MGKPFDVFDSPPAFILVFEVDLNTVSLKYFNAVDQFDNNPAVKFRNVLVSPENTDPYIVPVIAFDSLPDLFVEHT